MTGFLDGRNLLVAGGTGNVGRVIVDALLHAGATVVVPSRSAMRIAALRAHATGAGDRLITVEGDVADENHGPKLVQDILADVGRLDGAVASLGGFVPAPSVLNAPPSDLRRALDGYVLSHFMVARAVIPALEQGGSYTFINDLLAFAPKFPGAGLISIASAAQAMFARVVMSEVGSSLRVTEVVLYTSFGRSDDDRRNRGSVTQQDVGRFVVRLVSDQGAAVSNQTIHLDSPEAARRLGTSVSP